jgi:plastocyanin
MRRRTVLRAAASLATAGVATIAGCGGGGDGDPTGTPANPVDMVTKGGTYYFDPIGLYVDPGATVTFRITSGSHSTTAYTASNPLSDQRRIPDDAEGWNSDTIRRGAFTHTFDIEGTYDYYCIPHKRNAMVGRIVVGSPGGPAEESEIPDGDVPESTRIVENGSVAYGAFDGA